MTDCSEVFIGIDSSKLRHAVAVAEGGRGGEVRFLGEIEARAPAVRKLARQLAARHGKLSFCYEAGPTGYGLYRLIEELGHTCMVVAPSMTPRKPGDRVKTNRRDALSLARLLRAGELTSVWAPDERHEAMRDLVRAREAAAADLRSKRQQLSAFLLRLGRHYTGKKTWGRAHVAWLMGQKLAHREQRILFEETMQALGEAQARVARLEQAIGAAVPDWALAETVTALMAMRGVDLIAATTILAEIGDLDRFRTPRELMAWLGLVPSEASTGDRADAAASPRPATAGRGACWWNAPGVIAIPRASGSPSRPECKPRRPPCAQSPGRRNRGSRRVIAPSAGKANFATSWCR